METVWDTDEKKITWQRLVKRRFAEKDHKREESEASVDASWIFRNSLKKQAEFHWPGMNFAGPGTHLEKRLKRGDRGVNCLDEIARIHEIDYSKAKNLKDKWKADDKMIRAITNLTGKKTTQERVVKTIMQAKRKLKL